MKKIFLTLCLVYGLSSMGQNQIVNLSTGTVNPANSTLAPVGNNDDTWIVELPDGSSQNAIVSNGKLGFGSTIYGQYPSNACGQWISPFVITTPGPAFGAINDVAPPEGDYIYTTSFTSTASINQQIGSAKIILSFAGADNSITNIAVNGHDHFQNIVFNPLAQNVTLTIPASEINIGGVNFIDITVHNNESWTALFLCGNMEICYLPLSAGSITGVTSSNPGETAVYSINPVPGATSYTWVVPYGATIISGQNTTSINVSFGTKSGNIKVTPKNSCGNGISNSLAVTVIPGCGCPPITGRPTVLMSSLPINSEDQLIANTVLDCSKTWILDKKIYVSPGITLTIQPGTIIKGRASASPALATALIIQTGAKIYAVGTEFCPIIFTAEADPLDGTYSISNIGKWGGVVIAGKATNNLTLALNGPYTGGCGGKLCAADGLGAFEGFSSAAAKNQFGANLSAGDVFDDEDNSGVLRYVSIRHAGAVVCVANEINALSLYSVGRGTTIDHIEIVSCADDAIELWGGTVCLKYMAMLYGNDDMFDFDDGYRGTAQFIFGLKTNTSASMDSDNGFEMDSDDNKSSNFPRSHPVIFNATMFGNAKNVFTGDNSGLAAIEAKELTEGEIYNSIFANFKSGLDIKQTPGIRASGIEAYNNWTSGSLAIKCNTFVGMTNDFTIDASSPAPPAALTTFSTTDKNVSLPATSGNSSIGINYNLAIDNVSNLVAFPVDVVPTISGSSITGCPVPTGGCFTTTSYKGAFDPAVGAKNWLKNWTYASSIKTVLGLQPCPTDLTKDGLTTAADLSQLLLKFATACVCDEDINQDGQVTNVDLGQLLLNFSKPCK
jgi:hypothetical protein